ncbi:hypothetical protein [Sanyastnella coralliicola]|uniref:hypothetical protein n=1 Tax=Sanyastnella coralliicola TaxID=3069118 RepID=UPI0027BA488A|nr:hypothetical protein [Longitalea sp. SCSIO 12813]
MRNNIIPKILLIALAFSLVMCDKYDDGPAISLISRTDRITNNWEVYQAKSDEENVTDEFDQYELFIRSDGTCELHAEYTFLGVDFTTETEGFWYFRDSDQNVEFDFDDDDFDDQYEILRLTSDELWLRDLDEALELKLNEI